MKTVDAAARARRSPRSSAEGETAAGVDSGGAVCAGSCMLALYVRLGWSFACVVEVREFCVLPGMIVVEFFEFGLEAHDLGHAQSRPLGGKPGGLVEVELFGRSADRAHDGPELHLVHRSHARAAVEP